MSRMTQPPRPQHLPSTCSCCNNKSHGQHPHPAGSCVAPNRGRIDPYLSHNMDTQTRSSQVLRIYWPTDLYSILSKSRFSPSVIVGWRNSDNDLVVVTTLPYLNLSIVSDLLAKDVLLMKYSIPHRQIYSVCGRDKLSLLGTVNCTSDRCDEIPRGRAPFIPHKSFFNFKYTKSMKYPEIDHSPSTGSHRMLGSILSSAQVFPYSFAQVILFDPPISSRLQYFALKPSSLELPENTSFTVISEQLEKTLVDQERETQELYEKILSHAEGSDEHLSKSREQSEKVLKNCIAQVNTCKDLGDAIRRKAQEVYPKLIAEFPTIQATKDTISHQMNGSRPTNTRGSRRFSVSELATESAKQVKGRLATYTSNLFDHYISPFFILLFLYLLLIFRVIAEAILVTLEWKPFPAWHALKEVSATAQQIDLRLQQFCYSPFQYLLIRRRSQDWTRNFASFNVEYVLFYNTIWLIVNDIIIGITLSKLILEFKDAIQSAATYLMEQLLTIELEKTILWLNDWPGGLKLNNELAAFFGGLFIWVIQFWGALHKHLVIPYLQIGLHLIAYSGFGGATLLLSVVSDLVSLVTLHVYAFYMSSGRIFHWQLTVLRSLFHLFRGKKRNILRNRVDSCSYQLDQLMMGTIFFIALIFLLPTVLIFYLTFAACRLTIVVVNAALESCLAFLNHFPLFAIMLYVKDFKRLPGGISFVMTENRKEKKDTDGSSIQSPTTYVILKPLPLPFSTMFFQYHLLFSRIRFLYLSVPVILRLLSGQFVPIQRSQLYALLYSKLPKKRESVAKMWSEMENEFLKKKTV